MKLATELAKIATGNTLYILDEPTTGLHFADMEKLLEVLQRLVDAGNTVLVIEHNLDVIKCADWLIDLGPEGGDAGGELVVDGHAGAGVRLRASETGRVLRHVLEKCGPAGSATPRPEAPAGSDAPAKKAAPRSRARGGKTR